MFWHGQTILKLTERFGFAEGLKIYVTRMWAGLTRAQQYSISLREYKQPLYLRTRSTDWDVFMHVIAEEEYRIRSVTHASAVRNFCDRITSRGEQPLIIDCGANTGFSARWFAKEYPESKIVAIEPEDGNYGMLLRNTHDIANIVPRKAAVLDRPGFIAIAPSGGGEWAFQVVSSDKGDIEAVTIAQIESEHADCRPFLVKIDIEGSEYGLFKSGAEWADDVPVIVLEPHDSLDPWQGTTDVVLHVLMRRPRDYLVQGEYIYVLTKKSLLDDASPPGA